MRLQAILFLFLLPLVFSCGEDGGIEGDNVLHYDGANVTAPTLPPGVYVPAIRFPQNLMRNVEGRSIEAVSIYMYEVPEVVRLVLAYDRSPQEPTGAIYQEDITDQLSSNSWSTVNLSTPYGISGAALWAGLQMNILSPVQTIGCDSGPANANGDWLFDGFDQQWLKFQDRSGESINWNIRVILSP